VPEAGEAPDVEVDRTLEHSIHFAEMGLLIRNLPEAYHRILGSEDTVRFAIHRR
jgi:hypothetical protein